MRFSSVLVNNSYRPKRYIMKTLFKIAVTSVIIATSASSCYVSQTTSVPRPVYQEPQQEAQEISFSTFYDELSPYGRWIDYPQYGRVWIANQPGFVPYQTDGHWAYTAYGWTWVSDYNWGWAPFHYGRWSYDNFYGWLWIPGYEWAPAWVSWRSGGGYYGWAPLSPGISIGVEIGFNTIPQHYWCFVPNQYMGSSNMRNYYAGRNNNITIINNTSIINTTNQYRGARYWQGPDRNDVERYTGKSIQPYELHDANKPGQQVSNNNINVYRPRIRQNDMEKGIPSFIDNKPRPGQLPTTAAPNRDMPNNGNNPNNTAPPNRPNTPPANTPAIPERPRPSIPQQQPLDNQRLPQVPQNPDNRPMPSKPQFTPPTNTPAVPERPRPFMPQQQHQQPVDNPRLPQVPQNRDNRPFPSRQYTPPTYTPVVPQRQRPFVPQQQPQQPVKLPKPSPVPQTPNNKPQQQRPQSVKKPQDN
jgi:hypothetical protein